MKQVELILKNEKTASYRVLTAIALVAHFLFFAFFMLYPAFFWKAVAALLSLIIYLIVRWRLWKQKNSPYFLDTKGVLFMVCAVWWFLLAIFLPAVICLLLGLMYNLAMRRAKLILGSHALYVYSPFKRVYPWQQLANAILKDGILTLDFQNNKLLQGPVEENQNVNEDEVNAFFRARLIASSQV